MVQRRYVLGGLTAAIALLAMLLLWEVVSTVFFALTVAYVLSPVRNQLRKRGLNRRLSAAVATAAGLVGTLALLSPIGIVLLLRLEDAVRFLEGAPDRLPIEIAGMEYVIVTEEATTTATGWLVTAATRIAGALPELLVKLALFVFVVYALLYYEQRTRRALMALVPPGYRDIAEAMHTRSRRTLYGIYVVQAATGIATFLIALPVFVAFGYTSPVVLATLAGVLQFIPVLGPSLLVVGLAGYGILVGEVIPAVAFLAVGGLCIALVPDVVVRPYLAAETADLPASLYFIGFVGGVLTIGPIGVIAGPLTVALVVELATQLSEEFNGIHVVEEPD